MGLVSFTNNEKGTQFLQITTIESVVPAGIGRSRMITVSAGGQMEELKMENFFSITGINFENVRLNDKMITDKITQLNSDGWQLVTVTPGVYAADKSTGIFITRYLFKK
ncbi:MAG: hypothetical protein K2X86_00860 [Cytophagaceae bacterium]|nr:hypothetical protein [Cytophagaceae bacterium]